MSIEDLPLDLIVMQMKTFTTPVNKACNMRTYFDNSSGCMGRGASLRREVKAKLDLVKHYKFNGLKEVRFLDEPYTFSAIFEVKNNKYLSCEVYIGEGAIELSKFKYIKEGAAMFDPKKNKIELELTKENDPINLVNNYFLAAHGETLENIMKKKKEEDN